MKESRSSADLRRKFNDHLERLRILAEQYDSGKVVMAYDLAVALRILVYDKGQTRSLLGLLQRKATTQFFGTPNSMRGTKIYPQFPLVAAVASAMIPAANEQIRHEAVATYLPIYDNLNAYSSDGQIDRLSWLRQPFAEWWGEPILSISQELIFSRKRLVRMMANKELGAHLDPTRDEQDSALIKQSALRFIYTDDKLSASPDRGMEFASIRQIAYEMQLTIDAELKDLCDAPATTILPPRDQMSGLRNIPKVGSINVFHNKAYLEGVLRDAEAKGDDETAKEIRSLIRWQPRP